MILEIIFLMESFLNIKHCVHSTQRIYTDQPHLLCHNSVIPFTGEGHETLSQPPGFELSPKFDVTGQ